MPSKARIPSPKASAFEPPRLIGRIPVTSPVSDTSEEEIVPAVLLSTPVTSALKLSAEETMRFVVEAVVLKRVTAVIAVEDAYGSCDAFVVEVAMKYEAVGVLVAIYAVPLNATSPVPIAPAFVPPRATGSTPVKSEVERSREAEEETAPPVVRRIPFASQLRLREVEMTSREEED